VTGRGSHRVAGVLALVAALSCARTKKAERPPEEGKQEAPKAEAPDRSEEKGVPPAEGRPRVPASPEALLAEGAIGRIQRSLAGRGLLGKHVDGELDPPTSAALRKFQQSEGLAATGFPDRETLRRLGIDPEEAYGRAGDAPR
jgi:peptidoglycan hydrolase-like protein with peptidoglycan-binding domain